MLLIRRGSLDVWLWVAGVVRWCRLSLRVVFPDDPSDSGAAAGAVGTAGRSGDR